MIDIICRPISTFPAPETRSRKRAHFGVSFGRTLDELKRELRYLGAKNVVLEMDLREQDIRQDGWPRANARPATPRVVLSLDSRHGPLRYPCDTYSTAEDNVRAIRLALEALRAVDRYGVTRRGEQYTGWRALPGAGQSTTTMTVDVAARVIHAAATEFSIGELLMDAERAAAAVRKALFVAHPDHGGTADEFHRVQEARKVLGTHHGRTL